MEFCRSSAGYLLLLEVILMSFMAPSGHAYTFYVGGRDGWVLSPYESYNHWAERNRFQVNDTLVFKYKKGEDSVLLVKKEDYETCKMRNPIKKLGSGESVFKFDRSGPFYFISGVPEKCKKAQKLVVVVLAARTKTPAAAPPSLPPSPSSPSPSPAPVTRPPSPSPSSPSPSPGPVTRPPSPSPVSEVPPAISPNPSAAAPSETVISPAAPPPESAASILSASRVTIGVVVVILAGAWLS